jgi:hypothetical protein
MTKSPQVLELEEELDELLHSLFTTTSSSTTFATSFLGLPNLVSRVLNTINAFLEVAVKVNDLFSHARLSYVLPTFVETTLKLF